MSELDTTPESTSSAFDASPEDIDLIPSRSPSLSSPRAMTDRPMLAALDLLLKNNLQTLQQVSQLVPPQTLAYLSLMMLEEVELHIRKAAGYSGLETPDTWRNFRSSERLGTPAWMAVLIRKGDKEARYANLAKDQANDLLGNESLRTTLRDDSAYANIAICLLDEEAAKDDSREAAEDPETARSGRMRRMLLHEAAVRKVGE